MKNRIYVIGNDSAMWRTMRDLGAPIVASWIDKDQTSPSCEHSDLSEIAEATSCIAHGQLTTHALIALGVAIGRGIPVYLVGMSDGLYAMDLHYQTKNVFAFESKASNPRANEPGQDLCHPGTGCRITLDVAIKLAAKA